MKSALMKFTLLLKAFMSGDTRGTRHFSLWKLSESDNFHKKKSLVSQV